MQTWIPDKLFSPKKAAVDDSPPSTGAPDKPFQALGIHPNPSDDFFSQFSNFTVVNHDNTVDIHLKSNRRKAMERLSQHIIHGAAHDSSARDPPPRCHPGTRAKINEHIITWFYNKEKKELLVWIYGPAGVGKSAIMQSLADKLAEYKYLGASVFVSRPNRRNDSRQLFITIAYQLAVHIEDYCAFITEKLGRDPELVNKGLAEQFRTFIIEPFVERMIGIGRKAWGILLDGLDELDEQRTQREVIHLITTFVVKYPQAPLFWVITSRPEPNISVTFRKDTPVSSYWEEDISVDSREACDDVERYLISSFQDIRKYFPHLVPDYWPSEEQFRSLVATASGLFAFANAAIQYIGDIDYADPVTRLEEVLYPLDHPTLSPSQVHPFAFLDDLYTRILNSIPSKIWPTTKRVLGVLLYHRKQHLGDHFGSFKGISKILGLELSAVHTSVNRCFSVLKMPPPEELNTGPVTFYHTSFVHYLTDPTRSGSFYISTENVEKVRPSLLEFWRGQEVRYAPQLDWRKEKYREQDNHNTDRANIDVVPGIQSFVRYTYVLSSIPPEVWPTTKRVLSVLLCSRTNLLLQELRSLKGISVILGLESSTIYYSLDGCSPVLKVPSSECVYTEPVTFRHTSFGGYLTNSTQSGAFHISAENADEEVLESLSQIWRNFQARYPPGLDSEYNSRWKKFCEQYDFDANSWDIKPCLFYSIHRALFSLLVENHDSERRGRPFISIQDQDRCFNLLGQLDSATICQGLRLQGMNPAKLLDWVFGIWKRYREKLSDRGIVREVPLGQIQFDHLDWPLFYPSYTYVIQDIANLQDDAAYDMIGPRSRHISSLKCLQQRCPQLPVLICGKVGKHFLLFKDTKPPQGVHIDYDTITFYTNFVRYHIIPYPIPYPDPQESVYLLRISFETIRKSFPQLDMVGWPNELDFLKLAGATSSGNGFAALTVRFIEDHHHASPAARLDQVLAVVDGCNTVHSSDRQNSYLDALYTHILSSIPTAEWQRTKRILGAIVYAQNNVLENGTTSLADISVILGIELDTTCNLLKACSSILRLPDQNGVDGNQVIFYDTSFIDYLQEPTRSNLFHVSGEDARADVLWSIIRIWQNFMKQPPSTRDCYTWTLHPDDESKSSNHKYIPDAILALLMENHDPTRAGGPFESQEDQDRCFDLLAQLDAETVCDGFGVAHVQRFSSWLADFWKVSREKLMNRGIIGEVQLAQLQFHHILPGSYLSYCTCKRVLDEVTYKKVYSRRMLSGLESFQQSCPQLPVLICGTPGKRFAFFEYQYTEADAEWLSSEDDPSEPGDTGIYTIPYDPGEVPSSS